MYGLPMLWHGDPQVFVFLLPRCAVWQQAEFCASVAYLCHGEEERATGIFPLLSCVTWRNTGLCFPLTVQHCLDLIWFYLFYFYVF